MIKKNKLTVSFHERRKHISLFCLGFEEDDDEDDPDTKDDPINEIQLKVSLLFIYFSLTRILVSHD